MKSQFFNEGSAYNTQRDYYSNSHFLITDEALVIVPGDPYYSLPFIDMIYIRNKILKKLIGILANHIGNIVDGIYVVMEKIEIK
jgi:hypothetical protein